MNQTIRSILDPDHLHVWQASRSHVVLPWGSVWGMHTWKMSSRERVSVSLSLAAQKTNHWIFFLSLSLSLVVVIPSVPERILLLVGPLFSYDYQLAKVQFHSYPELWTWTCEYGFVCLWVGSVNLAHAVSTDRAIQLRDAPCSQGKPPLGPRSSQTDPWCTGIPLGALCESQTALPHWQQVLSDVGRIPALSKDVLSIERFPSSLSHRVQ